MSGHAEFNQEYQPAPYGYTTQALSSVASNSDHDINKPVATAQQGTYSNAGMPAPAKHFQSMGGPIASPQPIIQQGQQMSRTPITMQAATAYYPRSSVPPRTLQNMARNPLGAVVNQPGQQPSSEYGPMPTMAPLMPNFTSFPPIMAVNQFPQMYQQRAYNPPQHPIIASQQYLWNYNIPPPQNSNGYFPSHGMSGYQSMPPQLPPQSIPAQLQPQHTTRKGTNEIPIIDPKTGKYVLFSDKNTEDSSSRPNNEKESENSDSNICVQFATQVAAVLNNIRSDVAPKPHEPVRIDTICSYKHEDLRVQETPVEKLVDENINELQNIENLSEVEFTDSRNLKCNEETAGPYYNKEIDSNSIIESESGAIKNIDLEVKTEVREKIVLEVPVETSVSETVESVKSEKLLPSSNAEKIGCNETKKINNIKSIEPDSSNNTQKSIQQVIMGFKEELVISSNNEALESSSSSVNTKTPKKVLKEGNMKKMKKESGLKRRIVAFLNTNESAEESSENVPSNTASFVSSATTALWKNKIDLKYKEDQWSPLNPEGKKKYDKEFLLQLRFHPLSLRKPNNLPKLNIIKKKHLQKLDKVNKVLPPPVNNPIQNIDPFIPGCAKAGFMPRMEKEKQPNSTNVNLKSLSSIEEIRENLSNLLKENAELEEIFNWVNSNVPDTNNPSFIRALVTAIHESCISDSKTGWEINTFKLKSKAPLILRYVSINEELQLQALYAAQSLSDKLGHPSGLLHQFFDILYDEGVISDESLIEWEKSNKGKESEKD